MRISDWSSDVCSSDLRLHAAANDIDLAAIFTIHGFCARVLREHALEVGQAFDVPELLTSDTALHEAIAADLWRWHGSTADAADDIVALWPGGPQRSEEHTSELQSLMRISYAVFCLKTKTEMDTQSTDRDMQSAGLNSPDKC